MSRHTTHRRALWLAALALVAALLAGCTVPGTISAGQPLPTAPAATLTPAPPPPVTFPQDEAQHHDLTEWWYYTGHLSGRDASGRAHTYGFELTFFQTLRSQIPPYYAAHFAISDISTGQFHYDEREGLLPASVIPAPGSTDGFTLALGGWSARGLGGHDHLSASMTGYSFQLALADKLPH